MVMIKSSTSLVALLGSAALSSAAALPVARGEPESPTKRMWKGRLGARGPWRNENDHYLINVDLTGDGPKKNGHGELIDINTRSLITPEQEEALRLHLKAELERSEPILAIGDNGHQVGHDPLTDLELAADLQARDDRLLDLAAKVIVGSGEARKTFPARSVDFSGLDAAAKSAGVSDEQITAAKEAIDGLTPEQRVGVENAVKHAMFAVLKPGEKRSLPGPAFLRKQTRSTDDVVAKLNEGGNVRIIGGHANADTGIVSAETAEQHGAPLLAQSQVKRSVADEMGGAPGYIDITSPVFNSTAQRLASLVLSTSNGTDEDSTFVLNASSSVRTQVFLVPLNSTETGEPEPQDGEPIKVNLKVPVFVAESAEVEPFCATFDPSPDAPEPMTVEPCSEPEDERSQIFLYDPETGAVKPNWTPTEDNQDLLAKVSDSVSTEIPTSNVTASASEVASSAVSSISALPTASPSVTASISVTAVPISYASESLLSAASAVESMPPSSATATSPSTLPLASEASSALSATQSIPDWLSESASAIPTGAISSASVGISEVPSSLAALPTASVTESISSATQPTSIASEIIVSASATDRLPSPSLPVETASTNPEIPSSIAASATVSRPIASASSAVATPKPSASANNVNLIFTPSNASVQSTDDEEDEEGEVSAPKFKRNVNAGVETDADDCLESTPNALSVLSASGTTPKPLVSGAPAKIEAPASGSASKPKLPEGASHANDQSKKVQLTHGDVQVENVQALAGRLVVRNWKRQQQVMMAPNDRRAADITAPYQWTWTPEDVTQKQSQEDAAVFAALGAAS